MDYLDPQKRFRQSVLMMVGYALMAVAIGCGTIVLLLLAYGFDIGKNGQVIQKGVVFVSSQPNPANISLNGKPSGSTTNTKLLLPAGRYTVQLSLNGYRNWQRAITVEGGDVQHFDYPMLFPQKLTTKNVHSYSSAPSVATQSPDHRWLVIADPTSDGVFDLYDLSNTNPNKSMQVLTLPAGVATKATTSQSWAVVDWADDNQHLLIKHTFDGKEEYIELDRQDVGQSLNLNAALSLSSGDISLRNQKFDQFYIYNTAEHSLETDALNSATPTAYLSNVLAYQPYGNDTMLYVTSDDAPAGHVNIRMQVGDTTYPLRTVLVSPNYLLQAASYNGPLYVAVGASAENRVYLYRDPVGQLGAHPGHPALAMRAMRINSPNYLSFSTTAQFIMCENGSSMVVYDIENSRSYTYSLKAPIDSPEAHVNWMDGDRLVYVSGGHLVVVDYDNTNAQRLMPLAANYLPFFTASFQHVYTLAQTAPSSLATNLSITPLIVP